MGQFLISEYAKALWNDVMDLASDVSLYSEVLVPTNVLLIAESYEAILKTVAVWRTITSVNVVKNIDRDTSKRNKLKWWSACFRSHAREVCKLSSSTKQFKNSAEQSKTLEDRIQVVQIVIPSAYI